MTKLEKKFSKTVAAIRENDDRAAAASNDEWYRKGKACLIRFDEDLLALSR